VLGLVAFSRAARSVATPTGQTQRADLAGGVVLASGLLVLWLDASGLVG
jgi:hypothetical protein